ncbi:MAG: DUF2846 domain-containing protein [Pseudoxanthomonas sp.]
MIIEGRARSLALLLQISDIPLAVGGGLDALQGKLVSKFLMSGFVLAAVALSSGCASVPLSNGAESTAAKAFQAPAEGKAGIYVYRSSFAGKALKKDVWIDGKCVGQSADKVFFYEQVQGGAEHKLSTESEFSPNDLLLYAEAGKNYFIRQIIKVGVFVGGAKLERVSDEEGKQEVSKLSLAQSGNCSG